MKISLTAQIEEVERELAWRDGNYRRAVGAHKMRESVAALHIERMKAVRATLQWLQKHETKIKSAELGW